MITTRLRAFTLLELLVALGLTAVIVGFTLAVSDRMFAAWSRQSTTVASRAAARIVFDRLARDLESALSGDDGRVWLAATILDDSENSGIWEPAPRQKPRGAVAGSLRLDTPSLREARFGQAGVWLRFFTAGGAMRSKISDEKSEVFSAPAAVAYQLIRHRSEGTAAGGAGRYWLYRTEVRPASSQGRPGTLEAGFDLDPNDAASAYAQASPGNDGAQAGDPFALTRPDNRDEVLAENVVDFGVRFYRRTEGGALELIFPVPGHDTVHLATTVPAPRGDSREMFPEEIEVMIRILTDDGARQLAAMEADAGASIPRPARDRDDVAWWWSIVEANSEVFTGWVSLPARAG